MQVPILGSHRIRHQDLKIKCTVKVTISVISLLSYRSKSFTAVHTLCFSVCPLFTKPPNFLFMFRNWHKNLTSPHSPLCLQISGYSLAYLLQLYLFYPTVAFVPFNRIYDVALFIYIHAVSVTECTWHLHWLWHWFTFFKAVVLKEMGPVTSDFHVHVFIAAACNMQSDVHFVIRTITIPVLCTIS